MLIIYYYFSLSKPKSKKNLILLRDDNYSMSTDNHLITTFKHFFKTKTQIIMKRLNYILGANVVATIMLIAAILTGCTKEGPVGPAGKDGANGTNGTNGGDANQTCKKCHNTAVVTAKKSEYWLSKHSHGEAAMEEAGNSTCAPCHESEGFKFVCKNNTSAAFTLNTTTKKYVNGYVTGTGSPFGPLTCHTCHNSLHTTYDSTDFYPLTTTSAVAMTMWGGTKTIDLQQFGGKSNLCVKCHQPRPMTNSTDGNVLDYALLASNPTAIFYDASVTGNKLIPVYRTHVHYGTVGAVFAGVGGVEFAGSRTKENSKHSSITTCSDCHMAPITGASGGHSFKAKGNFNGCNISGCHTDLSAKSTKITDVQNEIKKLLNDLGAKLTSDGVSILNTNPNTDEELGSVNLWAGLTDKKFDGYLDVYDPTLNPDGKLKNGNPASTWSAEAKAQNAILTNLHLTNAQMGAIINFQFGLREYSLGIHNYAYVKYLLTNSLEKL